ncbi:hypothetical protein MAR_022779 [Mya arenaria]|uniref:Uncharacterized protein n=1 Tax=Mya arenaria TaxID=6604 RepID=A0ABY7DP83_MYAAR|nr:hypothetical protein MAR_022779 [Mya arenaria]
MDEIHRELLMKRQKYLRDNIIMEERLLRRLKDCGVFSNSMIQTIQEYPWVVDNFREKEQDLMEHARANSDVNPDIRQTVKEYVRELARTTRMNNAQRKNVEDFLCRQITIDTNLNNGSMPGKKLYSIHKLLMQAMHVTSLNENEQMDVNNILPDNVTIDKIETEVMHMVNRVQDLETVIDTCYEKLGETNKEKELPDLVWTQQKQLLEKEIQIEELKAKVTTQHKTMRLAREKEKRAREESVKNSKDKEDVERSLDILKAKIHKMQEERQRIGMRMAFDSGNAIVASTSTAATSAEASTMQDPSHSEQKPPKVRMEEKTKHVHVDDKTSRLWEH